MPKGNRKTEGFNVDWAYISELKNYVGKEVLIKGWVYNTRASGKNIKFIIVRDGSGLVQGVLVKGEADEKCMELFDELTQETSLELVGLVKAEGRDRKS